MFCKIMMFICVLFPALGMAQSGFIKVYDDFLPDKTYFDDMLVDNDTIVLYSLAWNAKQSLGYGY